MASEIIVAVIGGGVGLATGIVGSLFAPWANWGVEKRRLRHAGRVERIKEWREGANRLDGDVHFMDLEWSEWYVTLYPEMSSVAKQQIDDATQGVPNPNHNEARMLIIGEIARIERDKWKLV
jgi:hypothetical protein